MNVRLKKSSRIAYILAGLLLLVIPPVLLALPFERGLCLFYRLVQLPCPACGTSRSFSLLFAGRPVAAFARNPLAVILFAVILLVIAYNSYRLLIGERCAEKDRSRRTNTHLRMAVVWFIGAVVLNWLYLLIRSLT